LVPARRVGRPVSVRTRWRSIAENDRHRQEAAVMATTITRASRSRPTSWQSIRSWAGATCRSRQPSPVMRTGIDGAGWIGCLPAR